MNQLLSSLVWVIPAFIVGITGLALAISRWSRHPQASLLVTLGISVNLLTHVVQMLVYGLVLPKLLASTGHANAGMVYGIAGFIFSLFYQAGALLVILAVFANRKPAAPLPPLR
jgi:hypothetical protein